MTTEAKEVLSGTSERIIGFSPEEMHAPFFLRIGALLIDYMVLMILPVLELFSSKTFGDMHIVTDRTIWFISAILFLFNIVVLPSLAGRSIGKMLTGLRIVNRDGTIPYHRTMFFRQTIGLLVSAVTLGLGCVLSLFNAKGRALHDYMAGTVVVQGRRRVVN
ncbi:MAG: RDD family protein [Pyrinomonadaceae bacterium]|nr:RDD family protein [Pyrinomonadaceae bacterium]MBP6213549.1 RDD family protein [Pyrinomonadaceae bacterium]